MDNILDTKNNGWAFEGILPSSALFVLPGAGDSHEGQEEQTGAVKNDMTLADKYTH